MIAILFTSCSFIKEAANTLNDVRSLSFKLGRANNFRVNGVNISRIHKISDISVTDALLLTQAVVSKRLPVEFTLNVLATNNRTASTGKRLDVLVGGIEWELFIDGKQTVNGRFSSPTNIPAAKQTTAIPITIGLDLMQFFREKSYEDLMNLALAIGGANGTSASLELKIRPTVTIDGLTFAYPNYITVVSKEFRNGAA
jgi:hypothetical protein